MSWQKKVAQKKQEQQALIPAEWQIERPAESAARARGVRLIEQRVIQQCGILTEDEIAITEAPSALALLDKVASGHLSAVAVTTAFCKRAAVAQQLTQCLTEIFFAEALERAKTLDAYLREHGKPIGPLHGLPISIKDSFLVKGIQTTVGWVSGIDSDPATSNSALVDVLLNAGAVLYCKTNLPQTSMTADSENNVFGRTLNPHNTSLTAGGSSGGEGSLVASRGSILGVGTDIAGSIRIPSLCCGVYGFKPTADRVPFGGQCSGGVLEGLPGLTPAAGPLAHTVEDLEVFMRVVLGASPEDYDASVHAVPWQSLPSATQERIRIGILGEDPNYPLHPPVRRALNLAISALEHAGHTIIHLPPKACRVSEAARLGMQYFITGPSPAEIGEDHFSGPNAEPPVRSVAQGASPFWTGPPPVDARLDPYFKYNELHKARQDLIDGWRKLWVDNNLDCVIGAGSQSTAVAHDTYGFPPYTLLYNVLDYPACIIPFGKASSIKDPEEMSVPGPSQPPYHPQEVDGAPCAIQIATRRFHDEECIRFAKLVDRVLKQC